jgi:hypothetical protein
VVTRLRLTRVGKRPSIVPVRHPASDEFNTKNLLFQSLCDSFKEIQHQQMRRIARKSVRFKRQVAVYPTLHLDNLSEREVEESWYSKEEIHVLKNEIQETVRMIVANDNKRILGTNQYCSRGLKYRTPLFRQRRQINKWRAMEAVLSVQDKHQRMAKKNLHDCEDYCETLAKVYPEMTAHCQEMARQLDLHDERYVQGLLLVQKQAPYCNQLHQTKHLHANIPVLLSIAIGHKQLNNASRQSSIVVNAIQSTATTSHPTGQPELLQQITRCVFMGT